jgi:hypothetical protein
VTVFGEEVNTGGWLLVIEIAAVLAIAFGCIELSRSLAMVHEAKPVELRREPGADRVPSRGWPRGRLPPGACAHQPVRDGLG